MTQRAVLLVLAGLGVAMAAGVLAFAPPAEEPAPPAQPALSTPSETYVYYFHGTYRCRTCRTIEAYAQEVVTTAFTAELQSGRVAWQALNVDEPANRHFVDDFGLYTRSVVLVDARDPKRFEVLEQVWQLVADKVAFQQYVEREIRAFRRS